MFNHYDTEEGLTKSTLRSKPGAYTLMKTQSFLWIKLNSIAILSEITSMEQVHSTHIRCLVHERNRL